MNKQEQIEEMANDISKCFPDKVDDGCFDKNMNCVSCIAMELYNAGYRKVPKFAVVLTKKEQNKILKATEKRIDQLKKQVELTRKETAKEIFKSFENAFSLYYPHGILTYKDFQNHFMYLAKQYGVEVEE